MSAPYRKRQVAPSALNVPASVLPMLLQAIGKQCWDEADSILERYPSALVRRIEEAPLSGCTLLEWFADSSGTPELYDFLLKRGAAWKVSGTIQFLTNSPGAVSENLVKNNRVDLLETLARHCGPEVLEVSLDGSSLLHAAINYRSPDTFAWILARAPHLMETVDKQGRTPAQLVRRGTAPFQASSQEIEEIGEYVRSWEVAQEARKVLESCASLGPAISR